MAGPTPLPKTNRFWQPEISKCIFVPTIAALNGIPTRAEINAGDDLSKEIAAVSGWMVQSNQIDTPDMGTRFVSQIGGRTTAPSSSITFYASKDGDDVRQVLPRGTSGFIVWMDGGDVATQPMDVFPVEVSSVGKQRGIDEKAFQVEIQFSVTDEPLEDVDIPAAA